jgi:hypothetical protein
VALNREDHSRATELFEESIALSREMGHGWGLAGSVMSLATVSYEQGDLERATKLFEESQYGRAMLSQIRQTLTARFAKPCTKKPL